MLLIGIMRFIRLMKIISRKARQEYRKDCKDILL